jgi:hypothetical protein
MLLCSTATFKKTGFQTYFSQVSLRCRHSGVNTPAQPTGERKKKKRRKGGATASNKNLGIWVKK